MEFRRAEKKSQRFRLALAGPSGSGKTFSALLLATGICRHIQKATGKPARIGLVDSEKGSSELYADKFEFDMLPIGPPYNPRKYSGAIKTAEREGYDVLIVDSISHAWAGEGGILDLKDRQAKNGGRGPLGDFGAWNVVNPVHNDFVAAMLDCKAHLIVTMRTKTAYEVERDSQGKTSVQKVGLKPEQRAGLEYEFTTVLDLSLPHHLATTSKDRTGLLDQRPPFAIDEDLGAELAAWLGKGASPSTRPASPPPRDAGDRQGQQEGARPPAQGDQGDNGKSGEIRQLYDQFQADGGDEETWRRLCSGVGITRTTCDDQALLQALRAELETWGQAPAGDPDPEPTPAPADEPGQGEIPEEPKAPDEGTIEYDQHLEQALGLMVTMVQNAMAVEGEDQVLKMVRVMLGLPDLGQLDHLSLAEVKVVLDKIDDRVGGEARQLSLGR